MKKGCYTYTINRWEFTIICFISGFRASVLLHITCMILMLSWQTSSCVLGCWKTYKEEFGKFLDFTEKTKFCVYEAWYKKNHTWETASSVGNLNLKGVVIKSCIPGSVFGLRIHWHGAAWQHSGQSFSLYTKCWWFQLLYL